MLIINFSDCTGQKVELPWNHSISPAVTECLVYVPGSMLLHKWYKESTASLYRCWFTSYVLNWVQREYCSTWVNKSWNVQPLRCTLVLQLFHALQCIYITMMNMIFSVKCKDSLCHGTNVRFFIRFLRLQRPTQAWLRGIVGWTSVSTGELSPTCVRPTADV